MRTVLLLLGFNLMVILLNGQDFIERNYFDNAKAKNAAIAAARYAEEGYYYTKFTTFLSSIDSSRLFADTALFFLKRSLMLSDTSIFHAPKSNLAALKYLRDGKYKLLEADSVIRDFYPMIEIKSHNFYGDESAIKLSNAVMDLFNASLLLRYDPTAEILEKVDYEVLPFDDEVIRLEADEASFQHAANAFEEEIKNFEALKKSLVNGSGDRKKRDEIETQMAFALSELQDISHRIKEIRELLSGKYLEDVSDVEAPEHLSQMPKVQNATSVTIDEEVPDGLVYKIQLGYYPQDVDKKTFEGLLPVSGETVNDDLARFYAGLFFSYKKAVEGNEHVRQSAIPDAFVVPFYDGEKISMSRAVEIERARGKE